DVIAIDMRSMQYGKEAVSLQVRGRINTRQVADGGIEIDQLCNVIRPGRSNPRRRNHEWNASGNLEVRHLSPGALFTQMPPVIGPENHDGVVVDGVEKFADLRVDVTDTRRIRAE